MGSRWYLQPEPLLKRPTFAVEEAREGRSTPTYVFAYNNPLAFSDADGLRIYPTVKMLPSKVVNPTSCAPMPGCTTTNFPNVKVSSSCFKAKKRDPECCKDGQKGSWKFDVWMDVEIQSEFDDPSSAGRPSADSPGLTLAQHEQLHASDSQSSYTSSLLNQQIQTECFDSFQKCEAARKDIAKAIYEYRARNQTYSCIAHDKHACP